MQRNQELRHHTLINRYIEQIDIAKMNSRKSYKIFLSVVFGYYEGVTNSEEIISNVVD